MRNLAVVALLMLGLAGCASAQQPDRDNLAELVPAATPISEVRSQGGRGLPAWLVRYAPDTVVVNTRERTLYYVDQNGDAVSYPISVAREGFGWSGESYIAEKKDWPSWTPTARMLAENPSLPDKMQGGRNNPLGAHALYLHSGGRDTLYRIHGTNDPESIGQSVSSGCIRMHDEHILHLSARVRIGTKVVVF